MTVNVEFVEEEERRRRKKEKEEEEEDQDQEQDQEPDEGGEGGKVLLQDEKPMKVQIPEPVEFDVTVLWNNHLPSSASAKKGKGEGKVV